MEALRLTGMPLILACDPFYPFLMYDLMTKLRLRAYTKLRTVNSSCLTETLTASKVLNAEKCHKPYAQYGTEVSLELGSIGNHFA